MSSLYPDTPKSKPGLSFPSSDERLRHMLEISLWTNALHDPDELLTEVVELIRKKLGYDFVAIWLLTENDQYITLRAGTGEAGRSLGQRHLRLKVGESNPLSLVAQTGIHTQQVISDEAAQPVYCLPTTHAELVLPLRAGDRLNGVLDVQRNEPKAFSQDEVMILQTLAGQIAMALLVSELHQKENRRRHLDRRVREAGQILAGQAAPREAPFLILERLATVVPYERGAFMVAVGDEMHVEAAHGFPDTTRALQMRIPISEGDIFEQIYKTNQPVIIDDVTASPTWRQQEWLEINYSWMGVPLIVLDKVIGMLSLTRKERNAFTSEDATLAMAFAGQAAIWLEGSRLYDQMASLNEELERKVQERTEELSQAYKVLERLDKTKADFIGIAAHELRTPLTVISGYANMLNANPLIKNNPSEAALMEGIIGGVNRMLQIINSMLDVTRIDSDVLDMHKSPTRLVTLVERVVKEFQGALSERHLTLELMDLNNLPILLVDPNLMYKVFYHLVNNAIKYTPDGGHIRVKGRVVKGTDIGDAVEIEVADTGIGIAPEHHKLIFEKFYQTGKLALHSSGATKFGGGGPGLGLAIAKGIVTAHDGKIWVESPGYDEINCPGSRFFVLLPLMRPGTGPLQGPG